MNSIAALLQAAEYLERRDREVEHGYASIPGPFVSLDSSNPSSLASSYTQSSNLKLVPSVLGDQNPNLSRRLNSKSSNKKPQGNRSTHNELEKNRRAHLRNCLEKLKDIVPLGGDSSRHTTLGLLNKAKHFIKALEEKERKASTHRDTLLREQRYLRRRLELLSTQVDAIHKRRSVSECSTSTVSSSHSSASESDEHEVDVIGYGGASDDDHSSIRSGSSDGGVTVTTWRQLTIGGDAWKTAKKWTTNKIIVLPLKKPCPFFPQKFSMCSKKASNFVSTFFKSQLRKRLKIPKTAENSKNGPHFLRWKEMQMKNLPKKLHVMNKIIQR